MSKRVCEVVDFQNSYIINSSAIGGQACNTCRTQALAACTLIDQASGQEQAYYLGKACIGEHMYLDGGISQVPTSEVCITFGANHYKLQKKFADHRDDVIHIACPDDEVQLFDGRTAVWTDLHFAISKQKATELRTTEAMIQATEQLRPLVARTRVQGAKGDHDAILEYPIPYMNFKPDRTAVQIDVGPVLFAGTAGKVASCVEGIHLSYIMYTEFDRAEFTVRAATAIGEAGNAETLHYSQIVHTEAKTTLYSLDV